MLKESLYALDGQMDNFKSRGSVIPEESEEEHMQPSAQQSQRDTHNANDMIYMQGADQEILSL